jgi:hypothetical protein
VALREDREGRRWSLCEVEGRRAIAAAGGATEDAIGQEVQIVFSRIDADGGSRKARIRA